MSAVCGLVESVREGGRGSEKENGKRVVVVLCE